jgi:hypothetical protein
VRIRVKAQVKFAIIGIDFLKHFSMMVDPVAPRLVIGGSATASSCLALTAAATTGLRDEKCRTQPPAALQPPAAPQPPAATAGKPPAATTGQPPAATAGQPPAATAGQPPAAVQQLHAEFSAAFATDWGQQPPLHHVVHAIETKGRPVTAKFRGRRGHPQDCCHHPVRPLRIHLNSVRPEERGNDVPEDDGSNLCRHSIRLHLLG